MSGFSLTLATDVPPLLEIEDLRIRFGAHEAVQGVSFTVHEGETLALVGESGSGKSLTALSAMTLLPDTACVAGRLRFAGRDIAGLTLAQQRALRGGEIGMIFQEPMTSLNPVMTIGAQIVETIRQHEKLSAKAARTRALELIDLVRIPDPQRRFHDYPHQLSGGMRQRVMIAMAVACRPRLLIADEPTTALDVTIQAQVLELIDSLRRELAMAVLLITHDLGVVGQWADRVVVMYAGRTVEAGDPAELFARPLHPYTRGLLGAAPRIDGHNHYTSGPLAEIPGSIASALGQTGCSFAPRCAHAEAGCRAEIPPLRALGEGRTVACRLAHADGTLT